MRARPDVLAVVHAHLPAAMALTLAGEVPDPGALPETALLLPRLPFVPFGDAGQRGARWRESRRRSPMDRTRCPGAALLERHGAVAVGRRMRVDQAIDRLELVEVLCRTWRDALLIRAAARAAARGLSFGRRAPAPGRRREGDRGGSHEHPRPGRRGRRHLHPDHVRARSASRRWRSCGRRATPVVALLVVPFSFGLGLLAAIADRRPRLGRAFQPGGHAGGGPRRPADVEVGPRLRRRPGHRRARGVARHPARRPRARSSWRR